jgi:alpha-D-xyloside xylohydrolase
MAKGEEASVMLPRAGYAGSWRTGAGLWSGDIWCTFEVLRSQFRAGISAQTSGFGLWTTDVGGYTAPPGGNCHATNSSYRELVQRWFQFGVTCPILRQHGYRDTEIWLYGEEAMASINATIAWRASPKIKVGITAAVPAPPPHPPFAPLPPTHTHTACPPPAPARPCRALSSWLTILLG